MTKSGSLVTNVKEKEMKISKNHLFSRIGPFWVIWSNNKKISKNFDGSSNMAIFGRYGSTTKIVYFEPDFSRTWNFQELFLAILSTISESFSKIVRLVFEKSSKKAPKNTALCEILVIQHFFWKTAVYVSCPYSKELSCKIWTKSLEPFSRKTDNQPTN